MNLAVVNEAVTEMNGVEHQFTEEEKNFVVQFAFRSGSLFRGTDSWNSTCGYGGRIMGETISEKVDEAWNF